MRKRPVLVAGFIGLLVESHLLLRGSHGLGNRKPDWPDFEAAIMEFLKKHFLK